MSASVFLIAPERLRDRVVGDVVLLDGVEGRHAVTVTRVRVGQAVDLVDGHGRRARAVVRSLPGGAVAELEVTAIADEDDAARTITVVQALPKGEHGELAVDLLTQAGATSIIPWAAEHCVAVWRDDKAVRGVEKWQNVATRAAKQCRRSLIPAVAPLASTREVTARIHAARQAVVLHEESRQPLAQLTLPDAGEIVLIVGPEGGISPRELDIFRAAGAVDAGLGPNVLRSSFAGAAAIMMLSSLGSTGAWEDEPHV